MSIYLTNVNAVEKAEAENLEVVAPDIYTLVIDIDSSFGWEIGKVNQMIDKLSEHYPVTQRSITVSKSGNLHFYIKLETSMTDMEKVALQAILGSDPVKELLSFVRAKRGDLGEPILMFEKKEWADGLWVSVG